MDYQRRFDQHVGDTSDHVQDRSVNFHMIMELKVSIICRGFGGGFFRQCRVELWRLSELYPIQTNSTLGIRVDPCVPGHTYSGKRSQMHYQGPDHGPMYRNATSSHSSALTSSVTRITICAYDNNQQCISISSIQLLVGSRERLARQPKSNWCLEVLDGNWISTNAWNISSK